jgi:hypothetical protein
MFDPEYQVCLRSSARTDMGRVRSNNEDNIHLWTEDNRVILAIVAEPYCRRNDSGQIDPSGSPAIRIGQSRRY